MLLTDKQTERQTNKRTFATDQKHNLLCRAGSKHPEMDSYLVVTL